MSTLALIGLGSNLGDRKHHLDSALAALGQATGITVRAVSSTHETAPVGGPAGQPPFLNAAAALETSLDPFQLLRALNNVEAEFSRDRSVHWGPRTLDLDLLLYGDRVIDDGPTLRVPHPRMAVRRFVLAPLAEIAPEAIDPLTRQTVSSLLENLDRRPSYVCLKMATAANQLVPRVLAALGSGAVRVDRGSEVPLDPPLEKTPQNPLHPMLETIIARHASRMNAARWPAEQLGDRWLVGDFWFDQLCVVGLALTDDAEWSKFRRRLVEARARVIRPTFVVNPPRSSSWLRAGSFNEPKRWFPPLGETPVLEIASKSDDEMLAEIVAACAATRSC
ncbi:MAG TPA: 2-amino-4-hydroxy-6-hydroxymethyldihydropteridine diphosphokinase [Isosphaeraceae bacterium]|nr:2-amino-4-hydroxy-6-hydroxymethyldihydropteridine diphosphokinase [Isosphaeraceae bacterium]